MVDAYFERVGYVGPRTVTAETLAALQLAHATHIPFENLDVLLGQPPRLTPDALFEKLVQQQRGGYCFEQNTLLLTVLESLGFTVTRLLARVRYRATGVRPRTHLLLKVEADGQSWLADVGFGAEGLLLPLPLRADQPVQHGVWHYRLVHEGFLWVLQSQSEGAWKDLYAFSEEPQYTPDVEVANHYTSTHPETIFKKRLTVQLPSLTQRTYVRNNEFVVDTPEGTTATPLASDDFLSTLATRFGLRLSSQADEEMLLQWLLNGGYDATGS